MKFNPCKTHSITTSRSRTPPLTLCRLGLEVSSFLKLLGVTLKDKLTFEKHIKNITFYIVQKTGLRKCYKTLGSKNALLKCFYAFILPSFEYCSLVWCFASDSHLKLLDHALNNI